jgi:hypothetical protein
MDEVELEPARRRRRKVSTRNKRPVTWAEYWRSAVFGRHLFVAMTLVGLAYAGTHLYESRFYSRIYPPVQIGMSHSEVDYLLGGPSAVEADGAVRRFSLPGRELTARFSSDGRLASITCGAGASNDATCPAIRKVGIGTHEVELLLRLGAPSREVFRGNDKTMYYDDMGLAFQMRFLEVRQLELHKGGGFTGYFPRALYSMVP